MKPSIGIVGAGIAGSLLALRMREMDWSVTLFDKANPPTDNCSHAAAGMLDTIGTLEDAEPLISRLGLESIEQWPSLLEKLDSPIRFGRKGTVAVAHPSDAEQWDQFLVRIQKLNPDAAMREIHRDKIDEIEPELDPRFMKALYFPLEGHIDNRHLLRELYQKLENLGVRLQFGQKVEDLNKHAVYLATTSDRFDKVVDTRGLEAKDKLDTLRGVRGELVIVRAPDVNFERPIRLLHPKQPIYVVPRPNHHYAIGATQIESEDQRPVTVRSVLEILSGAYILHSGFGEAEILEMVANCRPAFLNNEPRIIRRNGIYYLNGLFRHGYLVSPKLTELAAAFLESGKKSETYESLYEEL